MTANPYTLSDFSTLLEQSDTHKLVIPNFQRRFEWDRAKQQRLAASVFCQLPIGAMVLFSGGRGDFAHNRLCVVDSTTSERSDVTYLLDGQQRLATLRSLFSDPFADLDDGASDDYKGWEATWKKLYPPLQTRWFLDVSAKDAAKSPLGGRSDDGSPLLDLAQARSLPSEPRDIADRIVPKRITLGTGRLSNPPWWHPAYEAKAIGEGRTALEIRSAIAKDAAVDDAIPLWDLARTDELDKGNIEPLHTLTARHLGRRLESDLRTLLETDSQDATVQRVLAVELGREDQLLLPERLTQLLVTRSAEWASAVSRTLEKLVVLQIPIITVGGGDLGRAVTIFENINEGGTPLTAFDLVNAKAVRDHEHLPPLRQRVADQLSEQSLDISAITDCLTPGEYQTTVSARQLTGVRTAQFPAKPAIIRNQYLNILSIFGHERNPQHSRERAEREPLTVDYIKKAQQLQLTAKQINYTTSVACKGLLRACLFLQGCTGKVAPEQTHYALMLVPIAAVLAHDELFTTSTVWAKLEYWYWVSLFGGRYREGQNDTCVRDIELLYKWSVRELPDNPYDRSRKRVFNEAGYSDREAFVPEIGGDRRVARAVEEGILEFTLARRPRDFLPRDWSKVMLSAAGARQEKEVTTTEPNGDKRSYKMALAKHHIVPLGSVTTVGKTTAELRKRGESLYNSVLNMTLISSFANGRISDRTPAGYLSDMEDLVLTSHCIDGKGDDIWTTTRDDRPLQDPPKEDGIRTVLDRRFDALSGAVQGRLDELEARAGE